MKLLTVGSSEKPSLDAKRDRSRAKSPIAIAGQGTVLELVLIIPKGILASEK